VFDKDKRKKVTHQIEQMTTNIEKECLAIIFSILPQKIQILGEMYNTRNEFNVKIQDAIIPNIPPDFNGKSKTEYKRSLFSLEIPQNNSVVEVMDLIQDELIQMSDIISTLSLWINLNAPRTFDQMKFEPDIQSKILKVLNDIESSNDRILDQFTTYHLNRADIALKVLTNPGLKDFRIALKKLDEKMYMKTCLLACQLRNNYVTLWDFFSKSLWRITL